IKRSRFAHPTGAQRSQLALAVTTTGHVEFVNDAMHFHVCHLHMQGKHRSSRAEWPEKEATRRTTTIDEIKLTLDQPTDFGRLVRFEDACRSHLFQFFLQILSKGDRSQRFSNRHFSIRNRFVTLEYGGVDAKRPDVDRGWICLAHSAVG